LLTLKIQEPLPGLVLPQMAADHGEEEAARRYRAIVVTTLRQLRGLSNARLRLIVDPREADEAVRFWLLPRLAERWQTQDSVFHADGWQIDFSENREPFDVHAFGEILCPNLGVRWVHTAMLGLERGTHRILGPAADGGHYFQAHAAGNLAEVPTRTLPELPIIRSSAHWSEALDSPLGPALKRAWEEEAN
jgi:glycosyltransferase A (GT-A) superfamily protein (DUF2064 family)